MICEVAALTIDPDKAGDFEDAVGRCAPLFRRASGCLGMKLERSVEAPGRYLLRVSWKTVEDHMVGFRGSEDFQTWRTEAGRFFVAPPDVFHSELVEAYF